MAEAAVDGAGGMAVFSVRAAERGRALRPMPRHREDNQPAAQGQDADRRRIGGSARGRAGEGAANRQYRRRKIFILPVENAARIRTAEKGGAAL
jgi:hypothetical protein